MPVVLLDVVAVPPCVTSVIVTGVALFVVHLSVTASPGEMVDLSAVSDVQDELDGGGGGGDGGITGGITGGMTGGTTGGIGGTSGGTVQQGGNISIGGGGGGVTTVQHGGSVSIVGGVAGVLTVQHGGSWSGVVTWTGGGGVGVVTVQQGGRTSGGGGITTGTGGGGGGGGGTTTGTGAVTTIACANDGVGLLKPSTTPVTAPIAMIPSTVNTPIFIGFHTVDSAFVFRYI